MYWRSARDHESRCRLGAEGFRVVEFTPEVDIQACRTSRRVWNSPIKKSSVRWNLRRKARRERPAAIQRQPKFRLTAVRVRLRKARCPLDPNLLSRVQDLPKPR